MEVDASAVNASYRLLKRPTLDDELEKHRAPQAIRRDGGS